MTEPPAKRRRIPEDQRKRSRQSCDRCKKHRCKCIKLPDNDVCEACAKARQKCTWTLPQKTRFYGSLEDLSDRYRCMEAVLKGAFPGEVFTTADDVRSFGERMHYAMPDLGSDQELLQDLTKPEEVHHSPISESHPAPETPSSGQRTLRSHDKTIKQAPRLVSDPYGRKHYIGPTGSLAFLAEVQDFVSAYDVPGHTSAQSSSSPFALDNVAKALETEGDQEENVEKSTGPTAPDIASPGSVASRASQITGIPHLDDVFQALPPPNLMDARIASYFDLVHTDFPLFHRATFRDEYETFVLTPIRQKARPQLASGLQPVKAFVPRADWGWFTCLLMIIAFGSLPGKVALRDYPNLHQKLSSISFSLLPQLIAKCTLSNVQALLLLSIYAHNNNERNTAWVLVGTATRMSFALGLHQNALDALYRPIERETRKRVWCTLYAFEQFLCSTLGRPSGIGDDEVEVRVPTEGLLDDSNGNGGDFEKQSLKLQLLLATARRLYVLDPNFGRGCKETSDQATLMSALLTATSIKSTRDLLQELGTWRNALPSNLQLPALAFETDSLADQSSMERLKLSLCRQNPRQVRTLLLLHVQYHYIVLLMTRSSLLRVGSFQSNRTSPQETSPFHAESRTESLDPFADLVTAAVDSAVQSAMLVIALEEFSVLNGMSGLDVFYAYSAAMVLLLRILLAERLQNAGTDRGTYPTSGLRELVSQLRRAISNVEKSKTMSRFANVVDKFAGVVESIVGRNCPLGATPQGGTGTQRNPTAIPSHPNRISTTAATAAVNLDPNSLASFADPGNSVAVPLTTQQLLRPNAHAPSIPDQSSSSSSYLATLPYQASPAVAVQSAPTWPPQQQAANIMPSTLVTFNGEFAHHPHLHHPSSSSSQIAQFYYDDPLRALTNGYITNWDDLDAFVSRY